MRYYIVHSETTIHEIEGDEYVFSDNIFKVYKNNKIVLVVNLEKIIAIEVNDI